MSESFRKNYRDQLPHPTGRAMAIWTVISTTVGIVGLFLSFAPLADADLRFIFATGYLTAIILALMAYILVREVQKRHRYAQSVYYTHFVNHVVRDFVGEVALRKKPSVKNTVDEIAQAAAACFTVLTSRRCRASVKQVLLNGKPGQQIDEKDIEIKTYARDEVSKIETRREAPRAHPIIENSDFQDLWHARSGCYRWYLNNNIPRDYMLNQYYNSSFRVLGEPKLRSLGPFSWITHWSLPYRSTIIWPIRYIPNHEYWPPAETYHETIPDKEKPHMWGFLCVDCGSRHVFDKTLATELGSAFADAIYTVIRVHDEFGGDSPSD